MCAKPTRMAGPRFIDLSFFWLCCLGLTRGVRVSRQATWSTALSALLERCLRHVRTAHHRTNRGSLPKWWWVGNQSASTRMINWWEWWTAITVRLAKGACCWPMGTTTPYATRTSKFVNHIQFPLAKVLPSSRLTCRWWEDLVRGPQLVSVEPWWQNRFLAPTTAYQSVFITKRADPTLVIWGFSTTQKTWTISTSFTLGQLFGQSQGLHICHIIMGRLQKTIAIQRTQYDVPNMTNLPGQYTSFHLLKTAELLDKKLIYTGLASFLNKLMGSKSIFVLFVVKMFCFSCWYFRIIYSGINELVKQEYYI